MEQIQRTLQSYEQNFKDIHDDLGELKEQMAALVGRGNIDGNVFTINRRLAEHDRELERHSDQLTGLNRNVWIGYGMALTLGAICGILYSVIRASMLGH